MTKQEWQSHSEEWQKGYSAYVWGLGCDTEPSEEWKDGYKFAYEERKETAPKGYVPM